MFSKTRDSRFLLFGTVAIILFYVFTYNYFGGNVPFRVHDNLDSNLIWLSYYVKCTNWFPSPSQELDKIMGSMPLGYVNSFEHLPVYIFRIFRDEKLAYILIRLVVSLVAFIGFYLFTRVIVQSGMWLRLTISLSFSLTSFWGTDMSVSGIPLVLFVLSSNFSVNIKRLALIGLGLCFNPVLTGWLVCVIILMFILFRKQCPSLLISFLVSQIFISYPLIYSYFQGVSHRAEMVFISEFGSILNLLTNNHVHLQDNHVYVLVILAIFLVARRRVAWSSRIGIGVFAVLIILSYCADYLNSLVSIPINFTRLWWLSTPVIYILFLMVMSEIKNSVLSLTAALIILILNVNSFEFYSVHSRSWDDYYRQDELCDWLSTNYSDRDKRILVYGFEPMAPVLCGFKIAGGYLPSYPIEYKTKFLKLVNSELTKNKALNDYYHFWGSRLYLVSSKNWVRGGQGSIYSGVAWNIEAFREQQIAVLSLYAIDGYEDYLKCSSNYYLYEFD
ncbi:MAG: hypothetical protein DWQ21_09275 [Bacteroidetes bacterium]|nr:MAG: hypothetical protein DWQ21_09275 [Bacteroidota bacterium]